MSIKRVIAKIPLTDFSKEVIVNFSLDGYSLKEGDLYVAKRNLGFELLTCKKVDKEHGWVEPLEFAYIYDIHECHKIMNMYYDIKLNEEIVTENQQGETCDEIYNFLKSKGELPTYTTYTFSAREFATYLASKHKVIVNVDYDEPEFTEGDLLCGECYMHLDRGEISSEEIAKRWNAGTMLYCTDIKPTDTLTVTISDHFCEEKKHSTYTFLAWRFEPIKK